MGVGGHGYSDLIIYTCMYILYIFIIIKIVFRISNFKMHFFVVAYMYEYI